MAGDLPIQSDLNREFCFPNLGELGLRGAWMVAAARTLFDDWHPDDWIRLAVESVLRFDCDGAILELAGEPKGQPLRELADSYERACGQLGVALFKRAEAAELVWSYYVELSLAGRAHPFSVVTLLEELGLRGVESGVHSVFEIHEDMLLSLDPDEEATREVQAIEARAVARIQLAFRAWPDEHPLPVD